MKLLTSISNLRYNMNQSSPSHFKYQKREFTPEPCHKDRLLKRGVLSKYTTSGKGSLLQLCPDQRPRLYSANFDPITTTFPSCHHSQLRTAPACRPSIRSIDSQTPIIRTPTLQLGSRPDKLGLKILHSKKRRYDETPPTANWNNGESLSNPAVRVKWAVGVMKRAKGYTTNQASKRDYAKTDGGLR